MFQIWRIFIKAIEMLQRRQGWFKKWLVSLRNESSVSRNVTFDLSIYFFFRKSNAPPSTTPRTTPSCWRSGARSRPTAWYPCTPTPARRRWSAPGRRATPSGTTGTPCWPLPVRKWPWGSSAPFPNSWPSSSRTWGWHTQGKIFLCRRLFVSQEVFQYLVRDGASTENCYWGRCFRPLGALASEVCSWNIHGQLREYQSCVCSWKFFEMALASMWSRERRRLWRQKSMRVLSVPYLWLQRSAISYQTILTDGPDKSFDLSDYRVSDSK